MTKLANLENLTQQETAADRELIRQMRLLGEIIKAFPEQIAKEAEKKVTETQRNAEYLNAEIARMLKTLSSIQGISEAAERFNRAAWAAENVSRKLPSKGLLLGLLVGIPLVCSMVGAGAMYFVMSEQWKVSQLQTEVQRLKGYETFTEHLNAVMTDSERKQIQEIYQRKTKPQEKTKKGEK